MREVGGESGEGRRMTKEKHRERTMRNVGLKISEW